MATEHDNLVKELTRQHDISKDVDGLVCKMVDIDKRIPMADRLSEVQEAEEKILEFMLNSRELKSIRNRNIEINSGAFSERVVSAFKIYERRLAHAKNTGDSKKDWYEMQEDLAKKIAYGKA